MKDQNGNPLMIDPALCEQYNRQAETCKAQADCAADLTIPNSTRANASREAVNALKEFNALAMDIGHAFMERLNEQEGGVRFSPGPECANSA